MKVVAVVVIFVVLWQWAGSTPLPCGNHACEQDTDSGHHCQHMNSNKIDRSKRELGLTNITNSIKRTAIAFGNKLHALGKREDTKFNVEDQVSEISNSSANYSSIQNTNGRFKRKHLNLTIMRNKSTGSIITPIILSRIERQTSNENSTKIAQDQTSGPQNSTKDKLQNTENGTQPQSMPKNIFGITSDMHIPDIKDKAPHKFFKIQVSESNNYTEAQNATKLKRQEPVHQNDTQENKNTSRLPRQIILHQSANITENTKNTTRNKKEASHHHHNDTQKVGSYNVTKTANDTKDTKYTTRVTRQTPQHKNNTSEVHIITNVTRLISDHPQNITHDTQNITTVKRQTPQYQYHKKRQTSDAANFTETQNTTMAKSQTDLKNSTTETENNSRVTRQTPFILQNKTQNAENATKIKRQAYNEQNVTRQTPFILQNKTQNVENTTKIRRQAYIEQNVTRQTPDHLLNENQDFLNITKMVRQISQHHHVDAKDNQNTTRLTRQVSPNYQNYTGPKSGNLNSNYPSAAQNSTKEKRQASNMNNNTVSSQNITLVERQSYKTNNRDAQNVYNKSIAKRQTSDFNNDAEAQNSSLIRMLHAVDTTGQGLSIKIIFESETTDLGNDTQVTKEKTTFKRELGNILNKGTNVTAVKVHNANYDNKTSAARNTTLNGHNTNQNVEITNVHKRQTAEIGNTTTESSNATIVKRNFVDKNQNQSITQKPLSNFENDNQKKQNETKARRQTSNSPKISDNIIVVRQITNLQNDSTKDTNVTNTKYNLINNEYHPTVPKNNKTIKREITEEVKTGLTSDMPISNISKKSINSKEYSSEEPRSLTIHEFQERKGISDRERKHVETPKNITIQIQRFVDVNQISKAKRNVDNITNNTNATDVNHQSLITKRYAFIANETSATNLNSSNSTTTANKKNSIQKINTSNANKTQQDGGVSKLRRQSSEDSLNSTSSDIAVHKSLTEINDPTINNTTINNTIIREIRQNFEIPPHSTFAEHVAIHKSHHHGSSSSKVNDTKGSKKTFKKRSTDCNNDLDTSGKDQEYRYTKRAIESFADQQTNLNNSDKVINTSINHKHKRDQQVPKKDVDFALNKTENNEHIVRNSSSISKITMSQNESLPQESSSYKITNVMKIAPRVSQTAKENKTISHSRKRRSDFLNPSNQNDATSTEQNSILSDSYLENSENGASQPTPIMFFYRLVSSTSKTTDTSSGDDYIQFDKPVSAEDKETDTNTVSIDKTDDDYYQYNLKGIPYRINSNYFGRMSDGVPDLQEKLGEEDMDINKAKPLKVERVKCSCAMYRSELSNQVKNPTFADNFVDVPLGTSGADKELLCIKNCSEMAKSDVNIKQEIYCTYHVKADSKKNEKMLAIDQKNFPEISEVIFCQIYTGDNEPALQFILSWVNVVLLDVVVCLSGLGIVCMYLICFVGWRKRDNGPVYTQASFTVK